MRLESLCYLAPSPRRQSVGGDALPETPEGDHAPAVGCVDRVRGVRQDVGDDIRGGRGQSEDEDALASERLWAAWSKW